MLATPIVLLATDARTSHSYTAHPAPDGAMSWTVIQQEQGTWQIAAEKWRLIADVPRGQVISTICLSIYEYVRIRTWYSNPSQHHIPPFPCLWPQFQLIPKALTRCLQCRAKHHHQANKLPPSRRSGTRSETGVARRKYRRVPCFSHPILKNWVRCG